MLRWVAATTILLVATTAAAVPRVDCARQRLFDVDAAGGYVSIDDDLIRVLPAAVDGGASIVDVCGRVDAAEIAVLPVGGEAADPVADGEPVGSGPAAPPEPDRPTMPDRDLPVAEPAPSPARPLPDALVDRLGCDAGGSGAPASPWALLLGFVLISGCRRRASSR